MSGLKVSLQKSAILASAGVSASKKTKITSVTQIRFTSNLGKYLGFKLFQGRVTKQDFEEVIVELSLSWLLGRVGFLISQVEWCWLTQLSRPYPLMGCRFNGIRSLFVII